MNVWITTVRYSHVFHTEWASQMARIDHLRDLDAAGQFSGVFHLSDPWTRGYPPWLVARFLTSVYLWWTRYLFLRHRLYPHVQGTRPQNRRREASIFTAFYNFAICLQNFTVPKTVCSKDGVLIRSHVAAVHPSTDNHDSRMPGSLIRSVQLRIRTQHIYLLWRILYCNLFINSQLEPYSINNL